MKTKLIFITSLIGLGMLMLACQKDNELIPVAVDDQFAATEQASAELMLFSEEDPNYQGDPMTNYPDPFVNSTTIQYRITEQGNVKLIVFKENSSFKVLLVSGYHSKGVYTKVWNAGAASVGKYIAELNVEGVISKESMTKKSQWEPNPIEGNEN